MFSMDHWMELEVARNEATHDELTGLLNRRGLEEAFNRLVGERPGGFSAVCIDLDDTKSINDAVGHQAGDEYIARAADILSASVRAHPAKRQPDSVAAARVGGDEFSLFLTGV